MLHTLVDTVEAGPSTQDAVPAGNGEATPVVRIALEKKLRRFGDAADVLAVEAQDDVSVAR